LKLRTIGVTRRRDAGQLSFDGTVRENIAFTKPGATYDEVQAVAKIANAHEFNPDSCRATTPSSGSAASSCRVVSVSASPSRARFSPIHACSFDGRRRHSTLKASRRSGICGAAYGAHDLVIARTGFTITSANQILVLERGQIVERGTHAELLAMGGRYRDLYDRQYQFEVDQFINPGEEIVATG
jgi:subfamily B ATP-binding cassette protein MsbA